MNLIIFSIGLFLCFSCQKKFTCTCSISDSTVSNMLISSSGFGAKSSAKKSCDNEQARIIGSTCVLK